MNITTKIKGIKRAPSDEFNYWIKADEEEWFGAQGMCPVCGHITIDVDNFCPHCGQRLQGRERINDYYS